MSDSIEPSAPRPDTDGSTGGSANREKVGDILHKERELRNITVETIAKDLKLNVNYIKAIEENDYARLPADPYVRVYLRSIAAYLMLNPEEILRKFFEDRGQKPITYEEERATRINVSMKQQRKQRAPWLIIALVVIALAIIAYTANKAGWISTSAPASQPKPAADTTADEEEPVDSAEALAPSEEASGDSAAEEPAARKAEPEDSVLAQPKDTMRLVLSATKDSVWVQIFSDGVTWKNFVYAKTPRVFTAVDSFNIHVGHNRIMRYTLNGSPLKIKKKGVVIFKLDASGTTFWSHGKWNRVFKGRID